MKSNKMTDDAFLILVVKNSFFVCLPIDCFVFFRHLLVFIQKLLKGLLDPIFCTTRLPRFRPVRPVGPTGQVPAGSATTPDRSDRLVRPIRLAEANFGCQHMPPCFFCKAYLPKNILLNQNCLRATISNVSAIYYI